MEEKLKKILSVLKETEDKIRKQKATLRKTINLAREPSKHVYKIEPLIQKIEKELKDTEFNKDLPLEIIAQLKDSIEEFKGEFRFNFAKSLQEVFTNHGMPLHGQLPILYTNFYRIEVDFYIGKADIFFGPEKIGRYSLIPEKIGKTICEINEELRRNSIKEEEYIKKLFQAWKTATVILNRDRIPITFILTQLAVSLQKKQFYENPAKTNYKGYPRHQFAYDLYRIRKKGVKYVDDKELNLISATFDATCKKSEYLWIPSNESGEGVNYSFIVFR